MYRPRLNSKYALILVLILFTHAYTRIIFPYFFGQAWKAPMREVIVPRTPTKAGSRNLEFIKWSAIYENVRIIELT